MIHEGNQITSVSVFASAASYAADNSVFSVDGAPAALYKAAQSVFVVPEGGGG